MVSEDSTILAGAPDPVPRLAQWLADAEREEPNNPTAMSVASVGADGRPSLRVLLLRGFDERGLVFYTNLSSRKGREFRHNPWVALCFHWKSLARQLRVEGQVVPVSASEADAYFAGRPRDSQIGAWASRQSETLNSRADLTLRVEKYAARYALGEVPRPPFWSGLRVVPQRIEFWVDQASRLHERDCYERTEGGWQTSLLSP